jgi:hypothetical protein
MAARIDKTLRGELRFRTGDIEWRFPSTILNLRPRIDVGESWRDGPCSFKAENRLVAMEFDGVAHPGPNAAPLLGWVNRPDPDMLIERFAVAVNARRPVEAWRAARALVKDGRSLLAAKEMMSP